MPKTTKRYTEQVGVRVDKETKIKLRKLTQEQRSNFSEYMREMLKKYLRGK